MQRPKTYLGEAVHEVFYAMAASAVSGIPLLVIGPSGCGKTDPILAALSLYTNGDATKLWRQTLGGGTPPSVIEGTIDIHKLVKEDVIAIKTEGTPSDPRYDAIFFDEITRANTATLSAMLNILGRRGWSGLGGGHPPLRVATSNFSWKELASMQGSALSTLQAIADRMGTIWVPAPTISASSPLGDLIIASMVRHADASFKERGYNALFGDLDPTSTMPRANEVRCFVRLFSYPEMARALEPESPDLEEVINELGREAATMLRNNGAEAVLSPRRIASWADITITTSFFMQFRAANPEKWRECYIEDEWDAYESVARASIEGWTITHATFGPMTRYGLISAFPSNTFEEYQAWRSTVNRAIGGDQRMIDLLREIHAQAVRATAMIPATEVGKKLEEIASFGNPFATRLATLYFELAHRIVTNARNTANSDDAIRWGNTLAFLDPKEWPLGEEARRAAEQAFRDYNIADVPVGARTRRKGGRAV